MRRDDLDVLLASNAALNRLDVEGMLEQYAPDAVVADHRRVSLGTFSGHDELRALYSGLVASAAELRETVTIIGREPGRLVAHAEVAARLATDPTGPEIGAIYGMVATIADDRIVRLELYDDGDDALAATGLERIRT